MTILSYQLYTSRNFPPLSGTLRMLADAGYDAVEGYGGVTGDPAALRAELDAAGLAMPTSHFALDAIESDPDAVVAAAGTIGVDTVIVPYIDAADRPADAAGWAAFGRRLAEAAKPVQDAGLTVAWHNHDFEFAAIDGDALPIELVLGASDALGLEIDLGWVSRAGADPVAWIDRFADRLVAAHVKDLAPEGVTEEDGWADVGHGRIDWAPIHTALRRAGVTRYVLEHDNPADHARFARRSIAAVRGW